MKQFVLIFILILVCKVVIGQTDKKYFSYAVTIGSGMAFGEPSSTPFVIQGQGFYQIGNRWSVGIGTGISVYDKVALIPLAGVAQFRLSSEEHRFIPYAECGIGYAFSTKKNANGGFNLTPSVGVKFKALKIVPLQFAVGYELQGIRHLKKYRDDYFLYEFKEQLSHNTLMVRLGVWF